MERRSSAEVALSQRGQVSQVERRWLQAHNLSKLTGRLDASNHSNHDEVDVQALETLNFTSRCEPEVHEPHPPRFPPRSSSTSQTSRSP